MSESRLNYLFQVYFNKTATARERDELMELLMHSENDERVKILLTDTWVQFSSQNKLFNNKRGDEMLANILQKEISKKNITGFKANGHRFKWKRLAAAGRIIDTIG